MTALENPLTVGGRLTTVVFTRQIDKPKEGKIYGGKVYHCLAVSVSRVFYGGGSLC